MPNIYLNIGASTVAWYAAIISTGAFFISIYNAWKNRPLIHIRYQKGWSVTANDGYYHPGTVYYGVDVMNRGHRTISIGNVGIKLLDGTALLLAESVNGKRNGVLTEENPKVTYLTPQDELPFEKFYRIEVYDQAGRVYYKYFSLFPTFHKIRHELKKKLYARR